MIWPHQSFHHDTICFESSLLQSNDPSSKLLSCTLPGKFLLAYIFSNSPPLVLIMYLMFESAHTNHSELLAFEPPLSPLVASIHPKKELQGLPAYKSE